MTKTRERETVAVVEVQGLQAPGSPSPGPAMTERDNAHTSASARDSFFMDSPLSDGEGRKPSKDSTLAPDRLEFKRLCYARMFPEARLLAERNLLGNEDRVAWVHNLGYIAREQGNLREAESIYISNAHLLPFCDDHEQIAKFCLSFGMCSQELGTLHGVREYYDRAMWAYRQASEHYELAGLKLKVAYALTNIGWLHVTLKTPERSFEYLDRAESLFIEANEPGRQAGVSIVRALAYEAQNDLANALECLSDAINLLDPVKDLEAKSYKEARVVLKRLGEMA